MTPPWRPATEMAPNPNTKDQQQQQIQAYEPKAYIVWKPSFKTITMQEPKNIFLHISQTPAYTSAPLALGRSLKHEGPEEELQQLRGESASELEEGPRGDLSTTRLHKGPASSPADRGGSRGHSFFLLLILLLLKLSCSWSESLSLSLSSLYLSRFDCRSRTCLSVAPARGVCALAPTALLNFFFISVHILRRPEGSAPLGPGILTAKTIPSPNICTKNSIPKYL